MKQQVLKEQVTRAWRELYGSEPSDELILRIMAAINYTRREKNFHPRMTDAEILYMLGDIIVNGVTD